jgi:hypothetical protein
VTADWCGELIRLRRQQLEIEGVVVDLKELVSRGLRWIIPSTRYSWRIHSTLYLPQNLLPVTAAEEPARNATSLLKASDLSTKKRRRPAKVLIMSIKTYLAARPAISPTPLATPDSNTSPACSSKTNPLKENGSTGEGFTSDAEAKQEVLVCSHHGTTRFCGRFVENGDWAFVHILTGRFLKLKLQDVELDYTPNHLRGVRF